MKRTPAHRLTALLAAALSLTAATFHWYYIEEHTLEWWGYGLFFTVAATAQTFYAGALLLWPRRWLYWVGIVGNAAIITLYVVTRTHGVPTGPDTGMIEEMQPPDLTATAIEGVLILCLAVLALLPPVLGSNGPSKRAVDQSSTEAAPVPEDEARMAEAR